MSVIRRTWPYGTRYRVTVHEATPKLLFVVTVHNSPAGEAFALVNHGVAPLPAVGSEGYITFTQGGPTGGYWQFSLTKTDS